MQSICLELVFSGTDGDTIQKLRRLYRDYDGRMNVERRGGASSVGVGGGHVKLRGRIGKMFVT